MIKPFSFLFIILCLALTVFSYLFIDLNFFHLDFFYSGFHINQRALATSGFVILISLLFAVYFVLLRFQISKRTLFLSSLILLFSYPAVASFDIFNYTTTAKVLFGYFENPYVVMPIEFVNEDFLSYTRAVNKLALYGPFWLILTGIPYLLTSWNFIIMMFSFKLLVGLFYFSSLYLIWKITKSRLSLTFFGLNPLVLFETFVSGHNDIVMMFFAILSFYLLQKNNFVFSGFSLLLSFLIKFATFFLIPVYFYVLLFKLIKRKINWDKIYLLGAFFMFLIFLLSPLREEIYPWYFIWVLSFVALSKNMKLYFLSGLFSFFLLLRYVPFMFLGTYFGITPYIKIVITFGPLMFLLGIFTYISLSSGKNK